MVQRAVDPKNPRVLLEGDHTELRGRLERLVLLMREDDPGAAIKAWRSFEDAMLAHFDVEEMYVFPNAEADEASEVRALRDDHEDIRRKAGEIGLAFELHTVRAEAVDELCEHLRQHAEREESLVYKHAERHLAVSIARAIYRRLRGAPPAPKVVRTARPRREAAPNR